MLKQYGRWGERFKEKTRLFSMHRPCIRRRAARQAAPKEGVREFDIRLYE
jgi:hypothetical protein